MIHIRLRLSLIALAISGIGILPSHVSRADSARAESRALSNRAPAFASGLEILKAQIQNDILSCLEKNRSSKTYADFGTSGYTPKDVFLNIQALRDPEAWVALCQTLDALDTVSLALFEEEVQNSKNSQKMACAGPLQQRLKKFWQESAANLKQHATELARKTRGGRTVASAFVTDERKVSIAESPIHSRELLKEKEIGLTFVDGPIPTRTVRILAILKAAHVRATFFHVGELIRAHPEIDHRLVEENHTLGTHGFQHRDLSRQDLKKAEKQIMKGREEAEAASGVDAPFFRPPFGKLTDDVRDILKKRKMPTFLTSIDSDDWKTRDAVDLFDRVLDRVEKEKGGTVLFHETQEQSVVALQYLIDEFKSRGYHFVVFVPGN